MRWVFLLLLLLNAFYYVWHQQDAPLRPKEVAPLAMSRGAQQDIRLLSEAGASASVDKDGPGMSQCLYLGGDISQGDAKVIDQRLKSLDISVQFSKKADGAGALYWLRVAPESRRLVDEALMGLLIQDFPKLKSKIMSCEGIATAE